MTNREDESKMELKRLVLSTKALLLHFNPAQLAEGASQQWQATAHQCEMSEIALSTPSQGERVETPSPQAVVVGGQKPFGHWVKHRLADGVFLPAVCYVPTGPDYTVVPLYTEQSDPGLQSRIDQYSVIGEDWLLPRKAPAADFGKLYTHPLAKQFYEAIQAVDNLGCDSTAVVDQLHALSKAVEQEINRLAVTSDGDVTDDMLNEGQERMCQMASRSVFEDHIQAEIYKAMRAVDPTFRNPTPSPSVVGNGERIAAAIEACDWSGLPIGNKEILRAAVRELRSLQAWQRGAISCREAEEARIDEYRRAVLDRPNLPPLLKRMDALLDDLSPEDTIGFSNGARWIDVATVEEIRNAAYPSPQPNVVGWRDISTAPKNTKVLAGYFNEAGKWRTVTACYHTQLDWSDEYGDHEQEYAPEDWYEENDSSEVIYPCRCQPMLWQPLPVPPAATEGSAE